MTQLVYHPAFDPYNTLLRSVRILAALPDGVHPVALRILDFYLLFPEQLIKIRLTNKLKSSVKKLGAEARYPYDRLPSPRNIFERMSSSFDAALQTMTMRGLVAAEERVGRVNLCKVNTPASLLNLADEQNASEASLMAILVAISIEFPLAGANGLKDRSGLAEYRYDAV